MNADMAMRWGDGEIIAPPGFLILAPTGDDLRAVHIASRKTARVSGAAIKVDGSPEAVQQEINYACAKCLQEISREGA